MTDPTPDVDWAIALSQARTRVVEAAKAWRCPPTSQSIHAYEADAAELGAAVDALEEVERRG